MNYHYPEDFPQASRNKVEAAKIRASRKFDSATAQLDWLQRHQDEGFAFFQAYVLQVFLVFAKEASKLWPLGKMDTNCRAFLSQFARDAYDQKGAKAERLRYGTHEDWDDNFFSAFERGLEKTPPWRYYENMLLKLANVTPSKNRRSIANRHAAIDEFISKVTTAAGRRITRKDIWTVAHYRDKTQFERYQRGDRATATATRAFDRVLNMQPDEFVKALEKKTSLL